MMLLAGGDLRPSRTATTAHHAVVNLRSPISSLSSGAPMFATHYGSQPTCTTPLPTISIQTERHFKISTRSGNSCRGQFTLGRWDQPPWIGRLDLKSYFRKLHHLGKALHPACRRVRGCNFLGMLPLTDKRKS